MGNQQRSSPQTREIIKEIHNGLIGDAYKAIAFYINSRGRVPNQVKANPPEGLDWELFQGPAPRRDYTHDTWDYNWHWYGWDYGTAEMGNNATHELDIARWALNVKYPEHVEVVAGKFQYKDDGWEMYDTMDATFRFSKITGPFNGMAKAVTDITNTVPAGAPLFTVLRARFTWTGEVTKYLA